MESGSESSFGAREETPLGMCITGDGNDVRLEVAKKEIIMNLFFYGDHFGPTEVGRRSKRKSKKKAACRSGGEEVRFAFLARISRANEHKQEKQTPGPSNGESSSDSRYPMPNTPSASKRKRPTEKGSFHANDVESTEGPSNTMTLLLRGFGYRGLFEIERGCGLGEVLEMVRERLRDVRGDQRDEAVVLNTWDGSTVDEDIWATRDQGGKMTLCLQERG